MNSFLNSHLKELSNHFDYPEMELRVLLNKTSVIDKEIFLSNFNLKQINLKLFKESIKRRLKKEPISKIFNSKNFWKYNFYVNKSVLDPRPETEHIIEKILHYFPNKKKKLKILDICTGSGCIAISLAKEYLNAKIIGTDISYKALKVAQINSEKMQCNNINFIKCDLLNKISKYDIVVSNPPYLSKHDLETISDAIKIYEPKIALFAKNNGYEFYTRLAALLPNIISKKSMVFIEIGHSQAKKSIKIFESNKLNCLEIIKDYQNLDRGIILNKT